PRVPGAGGQVLPLVGVVVVVVQLGPRPAPVPLDVAPALRPHRPAHHLPRAHLGEGGLLPGAGRAVPQRHQATALPAGPAPSPRPARRRRARAPRTPPAARWPPASCPARR